MPTTYECKIGSDRAGEKHVRLVFGYIGIRFSRRMVHRLVVDTSFADMS